MKFNELEINSAETHVIADNLRSLLKSRKVSENEVAQALGVPVMTIRRLVSGETTDPRVSTLKTLANYFEVSVDDLIEGHKASAGVELVGKNKPIFVPMLDWSTAEKMQSIYDVDLSTWKEWHPVSLGQKGSMSEKSFGLESRPSMSPRFQQGTFFIIDPDVAPSDGDMVLVRIKKNNEITLRELSVDPPEWQLHPVVTGSNVLEYASEHYDIVGVVILTMLYNKKIYG